MYVFFLHMECMMYLPIYAWLCVYPDTNISYLYPYLIREWLKRISRRAIMYIYINTSRERGDPQVYYTVCMYIYIYIHTLCDFIWLYTCMYISEDIGWSLKIQADRRAGRQVCAINCNARWWYVVQAPITRACSPTGCNGMEWNGMENGMEWNGMENGMEWNGMGWNVCMICMILYEYGYVPLRLYVRTYVCMYVCWYSWMHVCVYMDVYVRVCMCHLAHVHVCMWIWYTCTYGGSWNGGSSKFPFQ